MLSDASNHVTLEKLYFSLKSDLIIEDTLLLKRLGPRLSTAVH